MAGKAKPKAKPKQKDEESDAKEVIGLEESIKSFRKLKDEKEQLAVRLKELNEQEAYLEQMIITRMTSEGLTKVSTEYGTASIGENIFPAVKDWDKAFPWIVKNHPELLSKTVKSAPWRELVAEGVVVPGVEQYKESNLSFRRK